MTERPDALDFLAVVSRPTFPSGTGDVGDYYNIRALINQHPDWNSAVLELNSRPTSVEWDGADLVVHQQGQPSISLNRVRTALFLPICLEIEETMLHPVDPTGPWPRFDVEQWRPVAAAFEDRLSRMSGTGEARCLNRPDRVRITNNKLLQYERLTAEGFSLPAAAVSQNWPSATALAAEQQLVAKNVSEGGWKSPVEFSPARLVRPDSPTDAWPTIWQRPIISDVELRCYVMGDDATVVELRRDPEILDVRSTNEGLPAGRVVDVKREWVDSMIAMTRALGLDYAVIDAIPTGSELHVLEVNANGVWWFLPPDVAAVLESRFHGWLANEVNSRRAY